MSDNNRTHEASSLRAFFDHQMQFVHELMTGLGHEGDEVEPLTGEDTRIIESFVDAANSRIRAVHDYAHQLREHVRGLYSHILQIAEEIPAVLDLNQEAFTLNPLVNALFVNSDDLEKLLKTSPDMRDFLQEHSPNQMPVIYALLTACRDEKSVLGIGMMGDMLVRDVPQKSVNFSSHTLHVPCTNKSEMAQACKKFLFDRAVLLIKQDMSARVVAEVTQTTDKSYEARLKSLNNPNVYLSTLIENLASPARILSIATSHYKLNKLGIKLADDDNQLANEFDIHEITWGDNSRNVVLQIAYPLQSRH